MCIFPAIAPGTLRCMQATLLIATVWHEEREKLRFAAKSPPILTAAFSGQANGNGARAEHAFGYSSIYYIMYFEFNLHFCAAAAAHIFAATNKTEWVHFITESALHGARLFRVIPLCVCVCFHSAADVIF